VATSADPSMVPRIEKELKVYKNLRMAYELTICDPYMVKLLEKYYTVHIKLMKDWGDYNESEVRFGDNP
jgi:hypothetical protein